MIGGARRPTLRVVRASALALLSACSYDAADAGPMIEMNSCSAPGDCAAGSECREGMCVAQRADAPLTITLQVTPVRALDGTEPLPIVLDRFLVEGPMLRTFDLPSSVQVRGVIRDAGTPIAGQVTFTPMDPVPGFAPRAVNVPLSAEAPAADADFSVRLLRGLTYRVVVQPSDSALPPYALTLLATADERIEVDYAALTAGHERTFAVDNVPADRSLLVRAFDAATGDPLSSTGAVADGRVVLKFAGEPPPLRLEIRPEQTYAAPDTAMLDTMACDAETPQYPVFTVAEADLGENADELPVIELPDAPERIRFEGTVQLCPAAQDHADADQVETLPITLKSRELYLPEGSHLTARYDTTTTATLDPQTGELRFCVQVMPGDYDVLASPALSLPCSLYAERRPIAPPVPGGNVSGSLLMLPQAAVLRGSLTTTDLAPVRAAAIDAVALNRAADIDMLPQDASVTRYNRSRQATTDDQGNFELPVDVGSYDVIVKPPPGSGFSWQVRHDVDIGKRQEFSTRLEMISPVAVEGRLRHDGDPSTLAGAEIAAFAIVENATEQPQTSAAETARRPEPRSERAVAIGRATADAEGNFKLLLPPAIHKGW